MRLCVRVMSAPHNANTTISFHLANNQHMFAGVSVRVEFLKCFTMPLKWHFHPISLYGPLFGPYILTFTRLFICHLLRFIFDGGVMAMPHLKPQKQQRKKKLRRRTFYQC